MQYTTTFLYTPRSPGYSAVWESRVYAPDIRIADYAGTGNKCGIRCVESIRYSNDLLKLTCCTS